MKYDVGLFVGHGYSEVNRSYDSGAVNGSTRENDLANKIVNKAISYLNGTGIAIHKDEQNYIDNDTFGNTYSTNYVLSVHINAGKGVGSEIYVPLGEKTFEVEKEIINGMVKLGFVNRGIKSRDYDTEAVVVRQNGVKLSGKDYYKEIRDAWNNKISLSIFEVGFIDSSDLEKIQKNIDEIAKVIALAISNLCDVKLNVKPNTQESTQAQSPPINNGLIRVKVDGVQIGAYKDIKNVLKAIEDAVLKNATEITIGKV